MFGVFKWSRIRGKLNSSLSMDQIEAVRELGKMKDPQAAPYLLQALQSPHASVRKEAAWELSQLPEWEPANVSERAWKAVLTGRLTEAHDLGQPAVEPLLKILGDEVFSLRLRQSIPTVLGRLKDRRAVPVLMKVAEEGDPELRRAAIRALGKLEAQEAGDLVLDSLEHPDPHVRAEAVEALRYVVVPDAFDTLLRLALTKSSIASVAAETLQSYTEQAGQALVAHLEQCGNGAVKAAANDPRLELLVLLGGAHALDSLRALAARPDLPKEFRAQLLQAMYGAACDNPFEGIERWHIEARIAAANLIGKFGDERALPCLTVLLEDSHDHVRWGAARSLGQIGGSEAIALLERALDDDDQNVRDAVQKELSRIGTPKAFHLLLEIREKRGGDPANRDALAKLLNRHKKKLAVEDLKQAAAIQDDEIAIRSIGKTPSHGALVNYQIVRDLAKTELRERKV